MPLFVKILLPTRSVLPVRPSVTCWNRLRALTRRFLRDGRKAASRSRSCERQRARIFRPNALRAPFFRASEGNERTNGVAGERPKAGERRRARRAPERERRGKVAGRSSQTRFSLTQTRVRERASERSPMARAGWRRPRSLRPSADHC